MRLGPFILNNEPQKHFWQDVWIGPSPLEDMFPSLNIVYMKAKCGDSAGYEYYIIESTFPMSSNKT